MHCEKYWRWRKFDTFLLRDEYAYYFKIRASAYFTYFNNLSRKNLINLLIFLRIQIKRYHIISIIYQKLSKNYIVHLRIMKNVRNVYYFDLHSIKHFILSVKLHANG